MVPDPFGGLCPLLSQGGLRQRTSCNHALDCDLALFGLARRVPNLVGRGMAPVAPTLEQTHTFQSMNLDSRTKHGCRREHRIPSRRGNRSGAFPSASGVARVLPERQISL